MKRISLLFAIVFFFTHLAYAQVPQGIPYQAAARAANGQALVNTAVKVRFSILDSVATGTVVYKETHSTTTNTVGLFNVNVGMGTPVTGTFNAINWGKNAKFMQMELDITGTGSSYVNMGTQQMLSVPYALYAGSAKNSDMVGGNLITAKPQIGFSSSSSWTCPVGVTRIKVELWGGGGGAGAGAAGVNCAGFSYGSIAGGVGGKGGYNSQVINVTPGQSYTITIGAGGTAGTQNCNNFCGSSYTIYPSGGSAGGTGGTSSFNGIFSAPGGTGGSAAVNNVYTPVAAGIDGAVVNYNYASVNYGTRTYIPSNELPPIPNCCANGGAPGASGQNCASSNPSPGEAGYCVISY